MLDRWARIRLVSEPSPTREDGVHLGHDLHAQEVRNQTEDGITVTCEKKGVGLSPLCHLIPPPSSLLSPPSPITAAQVQSIKI